MSITSAPTSLFFFLFSWFYKEMGLLPFKITLFKQVQKFKHLNNTYQECIQWWNREIYDSKKVWGVGVHPWSLTVTTALPNLLSLHIFYSYISFYCAYIPCLLSSACFLCDLLPSDVAALSVFWSFIGTWSGKFCKTSSGSFLRFPQCWRWQ